MISVIIPTYNRARTISDCLYSVLNQTYKNIEIIVVDDCSEDNTCEIVEKLMDADPRINLLRLTKNSGACYARNYGVRFAKGDIIAFQDSDDIWHSDKLEKQLRFMNDNNADVVFCALETTLINGEKMRVPDIGFSKTNIDFNTLIKKSITSTQTLLIKKECFSNILFDTKLPRLQDWDLVLRLTIGYKVVFFNEVLVDAYIQSDSISTDPHKLILASDIIKAKYPNNTYAKFYLTNCKRIAYKMDKNFWLSTFCLLKMFFYSPKLFLDFLKYR